MSAAATDEVVYLDHNATTPVAPEVLEAMLAYLRTAYGNPSSDHTLGRRARQAVEEARASVAALVGAAPSEIVLTSGGTESNNLAIRGVAARAPSDRRRIVNSAVEHPATASGDRRTPGAARRLGMDACPRARRRVGALYVRRGTPLAPLVVGAGQEGGLRPGTENVAGIVGLGVAAGLAIDRLDADVARIAQLRDELWRALSARVDGTRRHTPDDACLPNTLLVSFPGVLGADVLARVPQIAASTGSACHAGEHAPNATLLAMGVDPEVALGAVRLSLGRGTTRAEIEAAVELLAGAHGALVAAPPSPTRSGTSKGTPR